MSLPFTIAELENAVFVGDVTKRPHPTLPLFIYNYSPDVQWRNAWNRVTRACRGLILDADYNIVARPWEKFFNLGQVNLPIQFDDPVEVMDKADGSLGILYPDGDGYAIATRGSFTSEQAIEATKILNDAYRQDFPNFDSDYSIGYTFLFEIIYPSNRIVLNYGDQRDLVLLGAVENSTGYYVSPIVAQAMLRWTGPVVEVMPYKTISDALGAMDRKNAEGYVVRSHNFMVKLKQPDYLELHRLVTNASPKTVWEQLKDGKSKTEIISQFPDEFHDYIGGMIDPLLEHYDLRLMEIIEGYEVNASKVGFNKERKDYAKEFSKHKDKKYYFLLLDERSIRDVLWSELKPSSE